MSGILDLQIEDKRNITRLPTFTDKQQIHKSIRNSQGDNTIGDTYIDSYEDTMKRKYYANLKLNIQSTIDNLKKPISERSEYREILEKVLEPPMEIMEWKRDITFINTIFTSYNNKRCNRNI